ncbi:hypothetical protein MRX96_025422 [Rhipicephalus microplus]
METNVRRAGFFRKLWQKLFRRVEDAYVVRQPPGTPSATASPARNTCQVEAVEITTPASLDVLRGPQDSNRKVQESSASDDASTTLRDDDLCHHLCQFSGSSTATAAW